MEFGKLFSKLTGSKKLIGDPEAMRRREEEIRRRLRAPGQATDLTANLSIDQLDQYNYQERARKNAELQAQRKNTSDIQPPTYSPNKNF